LFAIDRLYGASPSGQGLFEIQVNGVPDVITFTGEQRMWFLGAMLATACEIEKVPLAYL
jgi:hypothetical protein